ncbi:CheR family methyltransferase [uncultured Thiohalocapsa sp.]|uniref:CheR family methyltransferase n=1 Tax=uncultured Thiohalocapsa sp. TaxID=768990 RepID=UPI0025FFF9ED|nr:CheR family methyltransferase [uncultured Thiohalocapsa sp.]
MSKPPKEPRGTEPSAAGQAHAPEPDAPAPERQPTDPPQGEPTPVAPVDAPERAPDPTPEHTAPADRVSGDPRRSDHPQRRGPAAAPVVGVVCSAGGLKALEALFGAVPPDSGLAWIVMPHLALDQPSMLGELLAKHTAVPVRAAEDNAVPRANTVYVARPSQGLTLRGGRMRIEPLKQPAQAEAALDGLLTSLAEDLGPAALGVILSGSGDAGVDGLRSIVDAGGLGVVQLPATAQFGAMPQAAIDAGLADLALPPAEIPAALLEHVRPGGDLLLKDFSEDTAEQSALRNILALLRVRTRYDFRDYRPSMVGRRIRRRMDQLSLADTAAYLRKLREEPAELERLYRDLMIGVTGFFRDEEAFATLRKQVIEPLVQRHRGDEPLRVWVPGCAAGQEAYSIAMLLLEAFSTGGRAANVQVFATDIDDSALEQARHGIYTEAAMQGLGRARRERFFTTLGGGRQQVGKALREVVVFAAQNLLRDPPFSRIDLISCRNVLIYLKPEAQEQVIARFHFALNPGGYLFLGTAESVGSNKDLFETLSKRWRIFRRTGPSRQDLIGVAMPLSEPLREMSAASPFAGFEQRTDFKETARRTLCELFAPAAVLINAGYDILYYNGPTAKYLEQPSGEPTRNLLELLRQGLLAPVRGACQTALREERPVRVGDAVALRDAEQVPVEVLAHPVRESRLAERLLLVTFRDLGEPAAADTQPVAAEPEGAELSTVEQLEFELRATRDDLRSTIEELQSANEQLRAANEEVISTNEEMQSTNEELQTSKEELQSLNEELATVNSQMQEKVAELEERNSDVNNLLASSNAATVFLDRGLRVKLFTPAAKDLMNLRPTDVDRPLEELSFRIDDQALLADCAGVLDTLAPIERRVSGAGGRRFLRRVQPYRSNDDRIDGVVITFTDVTASSAAEARLAASERHYRHLFEASPIPMLQQDWSAVAPLLAQWGTAAHDPAFFRAHPDQAAACRTAIRLQAVNAAARRLLGLPDDFPLPQPLPGNCCPDELDKILAALAAGERVASAEAQVQRPGGPPHPMLCQLALMPGSEAAMDQMLVLMLDIHEQKALERELQTSEQRLRRALRVVHEAVWEHDLLHRRLWWSDEYERHFGRPTPSQPPAQDWWLDGIHPADRDAARAQVRQAIDAHAEEWQAEYRMRRPDGRTMHVLARGALTWNADGALTSMLGCMLDVSDLKAAQDALAERETRLRSVLEAAAEAIVTTDADGRIQTFNPAAEAMFRCTADAVAGKPVRGLFARGDGAPTDPLVEQPDHQPRQLEGRRAQGEPFPLELSARFVPEQQLWVLVGRDVSERRRLERDVIDLSTRQQEEVGREIHDGLGQELTALVMLAHSLRRQLEDQPSQASADAFVQLEDYLRHALETCRSIARGLSAEVSAPGLENALAELTAGMERAAGVPCRFTHTGSCAGIGEQQAAHLYRIAQEAISNAMRHAQAQRVDVSLEVGETDVVLRIRDDGQGISPGAKRGLGLRLMAYRAGMLGGTCEVAPADGGGTLVACRVPRQR